MVKAYRHFILVGDQNNWLISIFYHIWGFSHETRGNWRTLNIGDYVAFYVTAPLKKIIGYGRIIEKFVNENKIWDDEKIFGKSIWKYKIKFEEIRLLKDWNRGVAVPNDIMLNTGRKLVDGPTFSKLVKKLPYD